MDITESKIYERALSSLPFQLGAIPLDLPPSTCLGWRGHFFVSYFVSCFVKCDLTKALFLWVFVRYKTRHEKTAQMLESIDFTGL